MSGIGSAMGPNMGGLFALVTQLRHPHFDLVHQAGGSKILVDTTCNILTLRLFTTLPLSSLFSQQKGLPLNFNIPIAARLSRALMRKDGRSSNHTGDTAFPLSSSSPPGQRGRLQGSPPRLSRYEPCHCAWVSSIRLPLTPPTWSHCLSELTAKTSPP